MYLYYVCWIFDFCQGHSVEQWPTLRIQIFETKKTMDGAKTRQWEGDACYNPLIPFSNTLAHLAQLVKAFTVPRCSHMSPVRTMPGPLGFFSFTKLIFSYFLILF